jgi:hypothetical protein
VNRRRLLLLFGGALFIGGAGVTLYPSFWDKLNPKNWDWDKANPAHWDWDRANPVKWASAVKGAFEDVGNWAANNVPGVREAAAGVKYAAEQALNKVVAPAARLVTAAGTAVVAPTITGLSWVKNQAIDPATGAIKAHLVNPVTGAIKEVIIEPLKLDVAFNFVSDKIYLTEAINFLKKNVIDKILGFIDDQLYNGLREIAKIGRMLQTSANQLANAPQELEKGKAKVQNDIRGQLERSLYLPTLDNIKKVNEGKAQLQKGLDQINQAAASDIVKKARLDVTVGKLKEALDASLLALRFLVSDDGKTGFLGELATITKTEIENTDKVISALGTQIQVLRDKLGAKGFCADPMPGQCDVPGRLKAFGKGLETLANGLIL